MGDDITNLEDYVAIVNTGNEPDSPAIFISNQPLSGRRDLMHERRYQFLGYSDGDMRVRLVNESGEPIVEETFTVFYQQHKTYHFIR